MADSDLAALGFDPRSVRHPYSSARFSWPNPSPQFDSPQHASLGANANAIHPATTPPLNQGTAIQSIDQRCQFRPQSQGHDNGFSRNVGRQNTLPAQVHVQPQAPQFNFDQQLGQQSAYSAQYRNQPQSFDQTMNSTQTVQTNDQSNPTDWSYDNSGSTGQTLPLTDAYASSLNAQTFLPYGSSPVSFLPNQSQFSTNMNTNLNANMNNIDNTYLAMNNELDPTSFSWHDIANQLYAGNQGMPEMSVGNQNFPNSPTDTLLEVRSLSSSDNGSACWNVVDINQQYDGSAIFNPSQTLHGRTFSDSSYSDVENQARLSWGSYNDIAGHAVGSPSSDSAGTFDCQEGTDFHDDVHIKQEKHPSPVLTTSTTPPIAIKTSNSPPRSPLRRNSPPARRQPRKNSMKSVTKGASKRQVPAVKVENEKRVGRRKGPLRPEQRKQASEIRKLGACLRCKFLKKTVGQDGVDQDVADLEISAIKVSPVRAVSPPMPVFGKYLVPG